MSNEGNYLCQLSIVNSQHLMIEILRIKNIQKSTVKAASYNFAVIAGDYKKSLFCAYFYYTWKDIP